MVGETGLVSMEGWVGVCSLVWRMGLGDDEVAMATRILADMVGSCDRLIWTEPVKYSENVCSIDETGVMVSMPGSVEVLSVRMVGEIRGACVKRTTLTGIECISVDGRYPDPMTIWPANTHRRTGAGSLTNTGYRINQTN